MISFKHKFIFIHIPKTGGTSVTHALQDFTEDKITFTTSPYNILNEDGRQGFTIHNSVYRNFENPDLYMHASIEDLYNQMGSDIFSFYLFTVVRNPFDRAISQTSFVNGVTTVPIPLQNFSMPKPQLDYLKLNGKIIVNNVIRFENLQLDFDKICKDIGLPNLTLNHKRKSKEPGYKQYYANTTKEMIARMYQDELDYLGYSF
jgi:hypothetical protein